MRRLSVAPGRSGEPFILEAYSGESIYVPTSAGITRNMINSAESNGQFLICSGGGVAGALPVPFHYHERERHDFLCVKGQLKVWLNDTCRVLNPGDYASVAPRSVHSYQFLSNHTEIFGIVVPGGWENFFRFIGDPYKGPLWPDVDNQNPIQTLVPRVKAASDNFDVVPMPGYKAADVQPWTKNDSVLHGTGDPYFLQDSQGPSAVIGGTVVRPIATGAETDGSFTLGSIEGSSFFQTQVLSGGIRFFTVSHCLHLSDGYLVISVDGSERSRIGPAETAWIPAGVWFDITVDSRYVKFYVYSVPGGLVDLLYEVGKDTPHTGPNCMIPESPAPFDREKLLEQAGKFSFEL